jgi:hypothetical protein
MPYRGNISCVLPVTAGVQPATSCCCCHRRLRRSRALSVLSGNVREAAGQHEHGYESGEEAGPLAKLLLRPSRACFGRAPPPPPPPHIRGRLTDLVRLRGRKNLAKVGDREGA